MRDKSRNKFDVGTLGHFTTKPTLIILFLVAKEVILIRILNFLNFFLVRKVVILQNSEVEKKTS